MSSVPTQVFNRHISILILLSIGCCFASAHIAARISFDQGTGLLTAVIFRSSVSLLFLTLIALWYKKGFSYSWKLAPWQLLLGLLIAIQSIAIYSAVARIPVGIALLGANTFPAQLALISWALGGKAPSRSAAILLGTIFIGLLLALDIPSLMQSDMGNVKHWIIGVSFALLAAFTFAIGLWVTENKLRHVAGNTRSFYTMLTVLITTIIAAKIDIVPNGLGWPADTLGWAMLFLLSLLYATGFISLFFLAPRLNLAQNAPAMNIEPVASLTLGWIILGQQLSTIQIIGGATVVSCIVLFAYIRK